MLKCGKCGASVTETAIFCSMCGVKLSETNAPARAATSDSPLTKAAIALAKASGLSKSQSTTRFGFAVRIMSVVAGIVLLAGAYLFYRNQNTPGGSPALNFIAPLDKFNRLVAAGTQSFEQGDFAAAIAKFEEAEKLNPNNTTVILQLARGYDATGQLDNALQKYTRVVELDAKNVEARYQRAEIQLNRGIWNSAFEDLQYLAVNAPTTEQGTRAKQILSNFTAKRTADELPDLVAGGNKKRSRRGVQLPEVDDIPPRLAMALPRLATGLPGGPPAIAPSSEEAMSAIILARDSKQRGARYLGTKQFALAADEFNKAHRNTPDDPDIYYLLGQAYSGMGKHSLARQNYEKCDGGVYQQVARNAAERAKDKERDEAKKQAKQAKKENKSED